MVWSPDRSWFSRDALDVAPELLGGQLRASLPAGEVAIRITEVEAYRGVADPGSHAYRGKTDRTELMFGPAGHIYIYFSYGMHWCMNIVCGAEGEASAVLLRAGEVIDGIELAQRRRPASRKTADLAQGPARLTTALGIGGELNGADLLAPNSLLRITLPAGASQRSYAVQKRGVATLEGDRICTGPRVGVSGAGGDGDTYPWRFWISGDPTVSRYRPGRPPKKQL